jgi:hypothetical protein
MQARKDEASVSPHQHFIVLVAQIPEKKEPKGV